MDIKTAEEMINSADVDSDGAEGISCNDCPAANECMDSCITCSAMSIRASRTVIAARDQRIAELEESVAFVRKSLAAESKWHENAVKDKLKAIKERDEARRDAHSMAMRIVNIYQLQRGERSDIYEYYRAAMEVAEKYKDAK